MYAVARQTIGGLAQGTTIKPPVVFEGGPLTFNPMLVSAFADLLGLDKDDIIVPDKPEVTVAYGCALATQTPLCEHAAWHRPGDLVRRMEDRKVTGQSEREDEDRPFFITAQERADFFARQLSPSDIRNIPRNRDRLDVWIGIDAGSTTSKFVFLDNSGTPVYSYYSNNRGAPLKVLCTALIAAR